MRRPTLHDAQLTAILREKVVAMTAEDRVRQAESLAYGNLKMEDDRATRSQVSAATKAVFATDVDRSPLKRTAARR